MPITHARPINPFALAAVAALLSTVGGLTQDEITGRLLDASRGLLTLRLAAEGAGSLPTREPLKVGEVVSAE